MSSGRCLPWATQHDCGRDKLHYLNPVPIHQIGERWIKKFERGKLAALGELKRQLEKRDE